MEVLKERGRRCECCGASPSDGVTVINVDHIKPRARYPELALVKANLQVLCSVCNHGKGNWDETDWRPAGAETTVTAERDDASTEEYISRLPPVWSRREEVQKLVENEKRLMAKIRKATQWPLAPRDMSSPRLVKKRARKA